MKFKSGSSEFVAVRSYSRWDEVKQRRETWQETTDRYVHFIKSERDGLIPSKVLKKIHEKILNFEVAPSMRAMWSAGPAAKFDNTAMYNCSFGSVNYIEAFSDALYILMNGTGWGYSVEKKEIDKLPIVTKLDQTKVIAKYVIPDNKSGWADSVKVLMENLYKGQEVEFDYSQLRPKGARLMTMGGRSSGPAPLISLHSYIKEILFNAQGRKLTSLECSDIMNQIAESVVVGGVRRSSEISFSDLDDELMRHAKDFPFPPRRYMSNNSAIYHKKPTAVEFLKEWSALASSGSGERGIFNLEVAKKRSPIRRDASKIQGSNPCVTGDTEILTDDGYKQIQDLVGQETKIWNGFNWSKVIPEVTGKNQELVTVNFSDGRSLTCTKYHKFHIAQGYTGKSNKINAQDLEPGMKLIKHEFPVIEHGPELVNPYTTGVVAAEGMELCKTVMVYKPKEMCLSRLEDVKSSRWEINNERHRIVLKSTPMSKLFVPLDYNLKSKLEWLAGLFDGDGTELKEGGLQLVSVNRPFLADLQKLLSTVGVQSKVLFANKAGYRMMPDNKGLGENKSYWCQDAYRICIGAVQMQTLKSLGLKCERMAFDKYPQRDASQFISIVDVTDAGIADTVYCFTEHKRNLGIFNGVITGQCNEILLRSQQFCNLSEVVVTAEDDLDTLMDKVETAVWIGVIQSSFTHFPYLSKQWKKNCEEERLLGVSLTGQFDNPELLSADALKALKQKAIKVAKHASQKMGLEMPTAITCVKPSGTVSQVVDSSSGIHPRFSKYYIRRYRISANDPLFKMIKAQGVKLTPENGQESLSENEVSTWVLSYPIKSPEGSKTKDEVSAIDQLEWYKKIQLNWCEHNASMTVYVKDSEWFEVGNWVYKNWDIINGVSFLPFDGGKYKQAPYEEINKDQYEKLLEKQVILDYSELKKYEMEDNTEGAKTIACSGDKCELI